MALMYLCNGCGRPYPPPRKRGRCPGCAREWTRGDSARRRQKWQHAIWTSAAWKRTRAAVLARDGYRCTSCGAQPLSARGLQAHHTLPISENDPSTWFDPSTIVTLCSSCHGRRDGSRSHNVSTSASF